MHLSHGVGNGDTSSAHAEVTMTPENTPRLPSSTGETVPELKQPADGNPIHYMSIESPSSSAETEIAIDELRASAGLAEARNKHDFLSRARSFRNFLCKALYDFFHTFV